MYMYCLNLLIHFGQCTQTILTSSIILCLAVVSVSVLRILCCSFVRLSIYLPNCCPFIFLPPSISHSFGRFSLSLYQTYGPTLSKIILIIRIKAILLQLERVQQYISGLSTYCIHRAQKQVNTVASAPTRDRLCFFMCGYSDYARVRCMLRSLAQLLLNLQFLFSLSLPLSLLFLISSFLLIICVFSSLLPLSLPILPSLYLLIAWREGRGSGDDAKPAKPVELKGMNLGGTNAWGNFDWRCHLGFIFIIPTMAHAALAQKIVQHTDTPFHTGLKCYSRPIKAALLAIIT